VTCKTGNCCAQQVTEAAVEEGYQKQSGTRHAAKNIVSHNTMHQLQHTSALKEPAYICINNINNNRRQQFPHQTIFTT
jgi:hypothetical protein